MRERRFIKYLKINLLAYLCLGVFIKINSQEKINPYPFMNMEYNHLYFSKDSSSFLKLYKKMNDLKLKNSNKVGVVHFGGSHVQAGTWSTTFVNNFQSEFKTTGGGYFVFPYKIAKTNGQPFATTFSDGKWKRFRAIGKDYCVPLGMCALSVSYHDSATNFGVALTKKAICKSFNSIKVYHNFTDGFEFAVDSIHNYIPIRKDFKEFGYTLFDFELPIDSINFKLVRKDSLHQDFILFGFSLDNNLQPGFYFAGLGANGAASGSFLKCGDLTSQFTSLGPDLVIMSLGVNDTQASNFAKEEYIENYDSLIMVIKKANPDAAIILTTTTDNFIKRKTSNKKTIIAKDAMFELMEKHNIAVWDLFSLMGGYKSMMKWQKAGLAGKDRVHFSPKGYVLLGNLMYEAVYKSYSANQKKIN
ncbi:MAG: GDSL-type esterase/lipase family protein [Bacteroidota bacterium]|nr:GDSL-type esterase/lipase family protein [Bacteroidota bacterium]MDP3145451.1 GDSL-type esterase/lipase family protein [Bacteroidota bacterium]MDP3557231.1 GDSL-type esterase/lipase family protein [Bacteroidota bacterium]